MNAIQRSVASRRKGAVFTPKDFDHLGTRADIDATLSRLARKGVIRRLARGLYDKPKTSARLGPLTPSPDAIADAIARKDGQVITVSPASAANALGLTTQVPAKSTYLTSGTTRDVSAGGRMIRLRHASSRHLVGAGTAAGTVVQALRHLGKGGVDDHDVTMIRGALRSKDRADLARHAPLLPAWMRPVARRIAIPDTTTA